MTAARFLEGTGVALKVVDEIDSTSSKLLEMAAILRELASTLAAFEAGGFPVFRDAWRALHAYQGRRVRVLPPREAPYDAEVTDVAPDGALVVTLPDGRSTPLSSAEISLRGK